MSKLITYCRRCRKETPAQACDPSGLCVFCLITDEIAVDRADYKRGWVKFRRYEKAGLDCVHIKEQLTRIATRLGKKVHARIGRPDLAIATLNAHLEEARNEVERGEGRSRIVIPRLGDMLAKNNRGAGASRLLRA